MKNIYICTNLVLQMDLKHFNLTQKINYLKQVSLVTVSVHALHNTFSLETKKLTYITRSRHILSKHVDKELKGHFIYSPIFRL